MRLPTPRLRPFILIASVTIFTALSGFAQDSANEIDVFETAPEPAVEVTPPNQGSFLLEYFQLDHRTANKLIREFSPKAGNAGDLRDILGNMVKAGEATLVETAWIRAKSGQRAKIESVREDIYATEFDPPEIPNVVGDVTVIETNVTADGAKSSSKSPALNTDSPSGSPLLHMTSATPAAFETRHVGFTVEIDPVFGAGSREVNINIAPEIIDRLEDQYFTNPDLTETAQGIEHISMPLFYAMKTTTQLTTIPGKYSILGFHTPHDKPDERVILLIKATTFRSH